MTGHSYYLNLYGQMEKFLFPDKSVIHGLRYLGRAGAASKRRKDGPAGWSI